MKRSTFTSITHRKLRKFTLTKNFSSTCLFSKDVTFTKFLPNYSTKILWNQLFSNMHKCAYDCKLISRNICKWEWREHSVKWKNEKCILTENISSNQLFSNFFSKAVNFTIFPQKCMRVNSRNFHTVERTLAPFYNKISVKSTLSHN